MIDLIFSEELFTTISLFAFAIFSNISGFSINSFITLYNWFESSFFSSETGFQYLKIKYEDTLIERPKLGFLKFGLAFLKVKDLKVRYRKNHRENDTYLHEFTRASSTSGIDENLDLPFVYELLYNLDETLNQANIPFELCYS